jgi:hypothetical protein
MRIYNRRTSPNTNHARQRTPLNFTTVSLLTPHADLTPRRAADPPSAASAQWEIDLGLGDLVSALAIDRRYTSFIRGTLAELNTDPAVIAWRQAALADFLKNADLLAACISLLPRLAGLRGGSAQMGTHKRNLLLETSDRLAELELYIGVVDDLHAALTSAALESTALRALRDRLADLLGDDNFRVLRDHLPEMRAPLQNIVSLTLGLNLDLQLRPVSAALIAVNSEPFTEPSSWLERLIGVRIDETGDSGIAPLHHLPKDPDQRILAPLFQDLDRLTTQIAAPVARALNRYVRVSTAGLSTLEFELAFYVSAARLIQRLTATFCRPAIAPVEERSAAFGGLVNVLLLLRGIEAVPSDLDMGAEGRIAILTGPNSGGKTTFLQAVGLAQAMFQAGLFIPADAARLSPVDHLLTHFPQLETRQQGRLAEEAARLRALLAETTAHSLILLNETFSSTSSGEALYLAHDLLCGLRAIGARAIFATHLVELAERTAEMEAAVAGDSGLFSLVAGVLIDDEARPVPTYRITRGQPLGRSYAQEIARRHGISLAQILERRG